jgi:16S rRNA (cytidine1402-2'-O)-methyltransferase
MAAGMLYIIGTPIGNLADMSPRCVETLRGLDVLYCEDTRVTAKLLSHLGVSVPTRALSDDIGPGRIAEAVAAVQAGKQVGFASDAGMPGISDPARRLTEAAWTAGIPPQVIPGPSALATLLAACPFVENSFTFVGFAPRKAGEREVFYQRIAESTEPTVFFESPRRAHGLLDELCGVLPDARRILLGREMTKLHEQFALFSAGEWPQLRPLIPELGEFSIAVEGAAPQPRDIDVEAGRAALQRLKAAGFSSRDAVRALAAALDIPLNAAKKLDY